jgi:hypothetical protein
MADAPSSGGFDPSALISVGVGVIANLISGIESAKEQRRLQEKLAKLSLEQQKELALSLQRTQGEVQKMALLYQALNLERDRTATSALNKQKFIGISILGISVVILAIVVYKVKNKK